MELDKGIRFAGLANKEGTLVAHSYRKGIIPLLMEKEIEILALQSSIRMSTRTTLEKKLGEALYAFTVYKKVKRATIPVRDSSGIIYLLMVSFDTDVNPESIILEGIIPRLNEIAALNE